MAKKITTRFDFTQDAPQDSLGQIHQDGVLGRVPKGSPEAKNNQSKAAIFNEYERIMAETSMAIGDYDFSAIFPGINIPDIGDAVRRLKQEVNSINSFLTGGSVNQGVDRRFFGIDVGWTALSQQNIATIYTDFYTPGIDNFPYEPSFEIIDIDVTNKVTVLGGKLLLPDGPVEISRTPATHGGYEFIVPSLSYDGNVTFNFGQTPAMPVNANNTIEVVDGKFRLPVTTQAINFQGQSLGYIREGMGACAKAFTYTDILGSGNKTTSIVFVSGTVVNGFIDINSPYTVRFGIDYISEGIAFSENPLAVPSNYDALLDPFTGIGIAGNTLPDTTTGNPYYVFYLQPTTELLALQVNLDTREMELETVGVTETGDLVLQNNVFGLYLIKNQYEPLLASNQVLVDNASLLSAGRLGHSAESSINFPNIDDSVVDIRQFKLKQIPVFTPPFLPENYLDRETFIESDIHGSIAKVVPLFVTVSFSTREDTQKILGISNSTTSRIVTSNANTIFDQFDIFSKTSMDDRIGSQAAVTSATADDKYLASTVNKLITGQFGIMPEVLGMNIKLTSNGSLVSDLATLNIVLSATIKNPNGDIIWKATTQTPEEIYSWNVDPISNLLASQIDEAKILFTLDVNPIGSETIEITQANVVLTTRYSKRFLPISGNGVRTSYDYINTPTNKILDMQFDGNGDLAISKTIPTIYETSIGQGWTNGSGIKANALLPLGGNGLVTYWKVVTSQVNQYIIYINSLGLHLARINIADPSNYEVVDISYTDIQNAGFSVIENNIDTNLLDSFIDLEVIVNERPKIIIPIKSNTTDEIRLRVISFNQGIKNTPRINDIFIEPSFFNNGYTLLGIRRLYEIDTEHISPGNNLDRIDGRMIYTTDGYNIKLTKVYPHLYINQLDYMAAHAPVVAILDITAYTGQSQINDMSLVFSDNRRRSRGYLSVDNITDEWMHTFSVYIKSQDILITQTVKHYVNEPLLTSIYSAKIGNFIPTYTEITGIRQGDWVEIIGTDGINSFITKYDPFTDTKSITSFNNEYEYPINYSHGAIVPLIDPWNNSQSGDLANLPWDGESWKEKTESYHSIEDSIDLLYNRIGRSFILGNDNSTINGFARQIIQYGSSISTNVVHVRSWPSPTIISSNIGIAKRLGIHSKNSFGEVFISSKKSSDYSITLLTDSNVGSNGNSFSFPYEIPGILPTNPIYNVLSNNIERKPLIELGSAAGTGIDSRLYDLERTNTHYENERIHDNSNSNNTFKLTGLHSLDIGLLNQNGELGHSDVSIGSGIFWRGDMPSGKIEDSFGLSPVLYETQYFSDSAIDEIPLTDSSHNSPVTILFDSPMDPFKSGIQERNTELIFVVKSTANTSADINVHVYDNYGLEDYTIAASLVVDSYIINNKTIRLGRLKLDSGLIKIRSWVKTYVSITQLTPNIILLKDPLMAQTSFIISSTRTIVGNENSTINKELDLKIGNRSITQAATSFIPTPSKLTIGDARLGKVLTFASNDSILVLANRRRVIDLYTMTGYKWISERLPDSFKSRITTGGYVTSQGTICIFSRHMDTNAFSIIKKKTNGEWIDDPVSLNIVNILAVKFLNDFAYLVIKDSNNDIILISISLNHDSNLTIIDSVTLNTSLFGNIYNINILPTINNLFIIAYAVQNSSGFRVYSDIISFSGPAIRNQIYSDLSTTIELDTIKVNDIAMIGQKPHITISYKKINTSNMTSVIYDTYIDNITDDLSVTPLAYIDTYSPVIEIVEPAPTTISPVFAFIGNQGYHNICTQLGNRLITKGQGNITEPLNTLIADQPIVYVYPEISRNNNLVMFPLYDSNTEVFSGIGAWEIAIPYAESKYSDSGYKDILGYNNMFALDLSTGTFRWNSPLRQYVKTTHTSSYSRNIHSEDFIYVDKDKFSAHTMRLNEIFRLGRIVDTEIDSLQEERLLYLGLVKVWQPYRNYLIGDTVQIKIVNEPVFVKANVNHLSASQFSFDTNYWERLAMNKWRPNLQYAKGTIVTYTDNNTSAIVIATITHIATNDFWTDVQNGKWYNVNGYVTLTPGKQYVPGERVRDVDTPDNQTFIVLKPFTYNGDLYQDISVGNLDFTSGLDVSSRVISYTGYK